jgi:hypothetical protein
MTSLSRRHGGDTEAHREDGGQDTRPTTPPDNSAAPDRVHPRPPAVGPASQQPSEAPEIIVPTGWNVSQAPQPATRFYRQRRLPWSEVCEHSGQRRARRSSGPAGSAPRQGAVGWTTTLRAEAGLLPLALVADTVNEYAVPLTSPVTVAPVASAAAGTVFTSVEPR